ncbi:MAG: PLP-dependent aspartate aminotransferase family protein [Christensenellaceae bacterium]|jgi:cystathionine beta-lyase/cystathionine gamma-synthase|nr:PLP-dependent aspartate aminotransferase family protein [Christensenellaceae bacterium]
MEFETLCVHGDEKAYEPTGALSMPIYQSATFSHPGLGVSSGYDYSRLQNPTREHAENLLCKLEGGVDALAFSSGMAAIAALMELFSPGEHFIFSDDIYGGSYRLFSSINRKNGLKSNSVNTSDFEAVAAAIRPNTKAIFVETPTNPMMQVSDIARIATLCKQKGLLLIVDNTFLTPYFQRPLEIGASIVVHSATKYLGGHNDTLAGFLVAGSAELSEKLRFIFKTTGAGLAPFDSWLIARGIKTLAVRMDRQQESALRLAGWMRGQRKIRAVHYVGLPEHPGYAISKKQASGFGAMISFELDSQESAKRVLESVRLIRFAESLGGVESLVTYPYLQTHADIPVETRKAKGIGDTLLRLSVGLESANDLITDLDAALNG